MYRGVILLNQMIFTRVLSLRRRVVCIAGSRMEAALGQIVFAFLIEAAAIEWKKAPTRKISARLVLGHLFLFILKCLSARPLCTQNTHYTAFDISTRRCVQ